MIIETNLIDISKITLDNYKTYNEKIKYEIHKISNVKKNKMKPKEIKISAEERKQQLKEYNHNYYLNVTKIKRKLAKEGKNDKRPGSNSRKKR